VDEVHARQLTSASRLLMVDEGCLTFTLRSRRNCRRRSLSLRHSGKQPRGSQGAMRSAVPVSAAKWRTPPEA
jgi:hypothetical protein